MQIHGRNYLIPVKANIQAEHEVRYESVDAGRLLDGLTRAGNRTNLVILDACRNNPFARSFRSSAGGLAQMDAPSGTLIAYSTAPGHVAADGDGRNGLYTEHLLAATRQPDLSIEQVFKTVRIEVERKTNGQQVPWESSSLKDEFFFHGKSLNDDTDGVQIPVPPEPDAQYDHQLELATWNSVSTQCNRRMYQIYLDQFPTGRFVELARLKLDDLGLWSRIEQAPSASAYTDYLGHYPQGCFAALARDRASNAIGTTPTPPAQSPEASHYFDVINVRSDDVLNMRASATPKARIVGHIPHDGRCVAYLEQERSLSTNRWIRVRHHGTRGWVVARYLNNAGPGRFQVVNVESWDVLNMRAKPDYESAKVGEIPPGGLCDEDTVAQTNQRRWVKVAYGENRGWVNSRYLRDNRGCR